MENFDTDDKSSTLGPILVILTFWKARHMTFVTDNNTLNIVDLDFPGLVRLQTVNARLLGFPPYEVH